MNTAKPTSFYEQEYVHVFVSVFDTTAALL